MRKLTSSLCAATVAFSFALGAAVPANAAPIVAPRAVADSNIINAQSRMVIEEWQQPNSSRVYRRDRRDVARSGFYRQGSGYYYNGHRGYRTPRRGYREYNGFWFPAGAFIAGAIIGGALNNPAPVYRAPAYRNVGNAHVEWCYNRYRSYRAYDNTFQPYNGPRRQCYSPYS